MIKVYERDSKEYKALEAVASLMNVLEMDKDHRVETVYFDYGQDWLWTTIITYKKDDNSFLSSYQALCPSDHELITDICTLESITQAVRQSLKGV